MTLPGSNRALGGAWSSVGSSPGSALFRLSQTSFARSTELTAAQAQMDGAVSHFLEESARFSTFACLVAGGGASRLARGGIFALGANATGRGAAVVQVVASVGSLGAEVFAFEGASRSLTSLSGQGSLNPNLWRWNGEGGVRQGVFSSAITFGALRGAGRAAQGQNIVFQHAAQSTAMVVGHNVAGAFHIIHAPEESLAQQFFGAELTNIQLASGMAALHSLAPGLHAWERGLDLGNQSQAARLSLERSRVEPNLFGPERLAVAEGPLPVEVRDEILRRDPRRNPNLILSENQNGDGGSGKPPSGPISSTPPPREELERARTEVSPVPPAVSVPPPGAEISPAAASVPPPSPAESVRDRPAIPPPARSAKEAATQDALPEDVYADGREQVRLISEHAYGGFRENSVLEGRYRLIRHLGKGGFGDVWFAHDLSVGRRPVAIKRLLREMVSDENMARFQREGEVQAHLNQRHVVTVFDLHRMESGEILMIMEYVPGHDLADVIQSMKYLRSPELFESLEPTQRQEVLDISHWYTPIRALDVFDKLCEGMQSAHSQRIAHHDLKPQNVRIGFERNPDESLRLDNDFIVKIMDWGVWRVIPAPKETGTTRRDSPPQHQSIVPSEMLTDRKTQEGFIQGTIGYMSPERTLSIEGYKDQATSDIYSLGTILAEMMTLRHPHEHYDVKQDPSSPRPQLVTNYHPGPHGPMQMMLRAALGAASARSFEELMGGEISPFLREIEQIARRAMDHNPIKRPQTVRELRDSVRAVRDKMVAEAELVARVEPEVRELDAIRAEEKRLESENYGAWGEFGNAIARNWHGTDRVLDRLSSLWDNWKDKFDEIVIPLLQGVSRFGDLPRAQAIIAELALKNLMRGGDRLSVGRREFLTRLILENDLNGQYAKVLQGNLAVGLRAVDFHGREALTDVRLKIVPLEQELDEGGEPRTIYREGTPLAEGSLESIREKMNLPRGYYVFEISRPGYKTMRRPVHVRLKDIRDALFNNQPFNLELGMVPQSPILEGWAVVSEGRATLGHDFRRDGTPTDVYSFPEHRREYKTFLMSGPVTVGDYMRFVQYKINELNRQLEELSTPPQTLRDLPEGTRRLVEEIREILPQSRSGVKPPTEESQVPETPLAEIFQDIEYYWRISGNREGEQWRFTLTDPATHRDPRGHPIFHNQPMHVINYDSADAYRRWFAEQTGLPVLIPTADQMEIVARGSFSWTYPWGYKFDPTFLATRKATTDEWKGSYAQPVGTYALGPERYRDRSLFGTEEAPILDVLGNVSEFTRSGPEENSIYFFGGSIRRSHGALFRPSARSFIGKSVHSDDCVGGFRMVIEDIPSLPANP